MGRENMSYDQSLADADRQIAALTAELTVVREDLKEAREFQAEAHDWNSRYVEEQQRADGLQEQVAEFCADAEVVGYYGERADSAGTYFREAYAAVVAEHDQVRKALEAVIRDCDGACPIIECNKMTHGNGHAPDCIVGLAVGHKQGGIA